MVLYQGMYNVAHFEINDNLLLNEDVLVGDEYDYKRLRKICFVSGSVYINKVIVGDSEIKGGAHVTIQDDSIFVNVVPENATDGIVIGITFYLNDSGDMYAYTEKREGGAQGTIVNSFNGRTGAVIPADSDYNAGLIGYNNEASQLVAENVQDAIDELDQDIDNIQDEIEGLDAEHVSYNNSTSTLLATNVQTAIDELDNDVSGKQNQLTFDSTPTATSQNPVTSDGILHAIETLESLIPTEASEIGYDNTVSGLTGISVQAAIDELATEKQDTLTFDSTPTDDSSNPVTSDGIKAALDEKQDALTFDSTPTDDSSNPVTSDGIKAALDEKADTSTLAPVENGATASRAYTIGEHFIRGGKYCVCIANIASGGSFTLNTNYRETSIAGELNGTYILTGTHTFTSTADGVKTFADLINDVMTQLATYLNTNPNLIFQYGELDSHGVPLTTENGLMNTQYFDTDFKSFFTYENSLVFKIIHARRSGSQSLYAYSNLTLNDDSDTIATADAHLTINVFRGL